MKTTRDWGLEWQCGRCGFWNILRISREVCAACCCVVLGDEPLHRGRRKRWAKRLTEGDQPT